MMVADSRTEAARAAVDHEPQPVRLICLQLDKMVTAANRGKFQYTRRSPEGLQPRITQHCAGNTLRSRNDPLPVPSSRGYRVTQTSEYSASDAWLTDRGCFNVE